MSSKPGPLIEAVEVASGFAWPECPRWHDGLLWFCDVYGERVLTLAPDGHVSTFVDLAPWRERNPGRHENGFVAGLGFLPDGRLLLNRMRDHIVLVTDGTDVELYADLAEVAQSPLNDMVVDADGRAYISQLGFDIWAGEAPRSAPLLVIGPDQQVRRAEEGGELTFGNGMTLSPDGSRLVVAEAALNRLTAFDVEGGQLQRRRVFADLDRHPDGICGDVDGGVWAAQPGPGGGCLRVVEGGEVTDRVRLGEGHAYAVACCLGGDDRRSLYLAGVGEGVDPRDVAGTIAAATGGIWEARVAAAGHGLP